MLFLLAAFGFIVGFILLFSTPDVTESSSSRVDILSIIASFVGFIMLIASTIFLTDAETWKNAPHFWLRSFATIALLATPYELDKIIKKSRTTLDFPLVKC